jgi:hypothetical protein
VPICNEYESVTVEADSGSSDSSVDIETVYLLDGNKIWIRFPAKGRDIHLVWGVNPDSEDNPASYLTSVRVKRPGREANHYPQSSVEIKNIRNYNSTRRFYRVLTMVCNTQNYWVFGLCPSLALSKGPNRVGVSPHLRTETDPVSETSCFSSNYVFRIRTMDKVRKPSNSVCYTSTPILFMEWCLII